MLQDVAEMAAAAGLPAYQDATQRPPLLEAFEKEPTAKGLAKIILGQKDDGEYQGLIGDDYPIEWEVMELKRGDVTEVALLAAKVRATSKPAPLP
jgi:hypothetical protein